MVVEIKPKTTTAESLGKGKTAKLETGNWKLTNALLTLSEHNGKWHIMRCILLGAARKDCQLPRASCLVPRAPCPMPRFAWQQFLCTFECLIILSFGIPQNYWDACPLSESVLLIPGLAFPAPLSSPWAIVMLVKCSYFLLSDSIKSVCSNF